jgi:thioredoxin-dependent peroxiredoxin
VEANRKFAEKFQFNFPLLCDVEKQVGLAYGATDSVDRPAPRRCSFLIGADGRIAKVFPKVSAGTHPGELLAELAAEATDGSG